MAGCTLVSMRTELLARTSSELSSSRGNDFINSAYRELLNEQPWPFLETTASGTAPLTISDLRQIIHVRDSTDDAVLEGADVRDLYDTNPDLDITGSPQNWWIDGLTTLRVWPLNTSHTISVRYLKVAPTLSSDSDTTVLPTEWCYMVVLGAQMLYLSEAVDNPDLTDRLQARYDRGLAKMIEAFMDRNYQGPAYVTQVLYATDA